MAQPNRKQAGRFTEPNLPPRVIVSDGGITIQHFYRSGDHGPPHLHIDEGGVSTRIGQNGRPLPIDQPVAALIRNAVHQELAAQRHERLPWFASHPDTPEDVLFEVCDLGLCLIELGHRSGPRALLQRLASRHRYPEAVLTLATELYTSPTESTADFEAFASQHADNGWMLETLARMGGSCVEKCEALRTIIARRGDAASLLKLMDIEDQLSRAAVTTDEAEVRRLLATREPAIWRALVSNPAVPRDVLTQLAAAKDMPLAREIRNRAGEKLKAY